MESKKEGVEGANQIAYNFKENGQSKMLLKYTQEALPIQLLILQ